MTGPGADLVALYRATRYDARLPGGRRATLRVDAPPPFEFRQWLAGAAFALITAYNPRSTAQPAHANRAAQHRLLADLAALGARVLPAVGRGHGWREASLVAAGLDLTSIDALAARYAQHAVLAGRGDAPVELRCYERAS
ncbi:DUF3293 domain-containing protein [Tahibacter soli]|uniref:DUF3293 domain-containing protein n=1 Tax=Tahibacter soli TaxID=2983605 RepID=A0A9X4BGZ2_9GAMM|nr:DUF3293 domain-containing protein [Tahibacter soli]MDC8011713.1 DUF3293 domain-containing protein [Tahibacter soli]